MENTFTLIFTKNELDVLSAALGELPFKAAAPVVHMINQQLMEQQPAPEPASPPKTPEAKPD